MRVVVDTNVLVAGLLSPYGAPGEIIRMAASGSLALCFDARILTEYLEVLSRPKFGFDPDQFRPLLDQIRVKGHVVASDPLPEELPDPDDQPFLEAALAGTARCLVTGNVRHFPASKRQGMKVVSPSEFLKFYRENMQGQGRGG